ncbi:hypothetical protein JAAARDRAFT_75369 [Jaapia argillacea MUCL 33604]|uniref:Uncharacterized protein n=1 Tax=Jaapia argillacea MUCL 33604 TaxID=933084 RepID=A0A067QDE7_9AGAM|nr:hypothetical protein JAAARDRAFT_75369 [Jaapia argillacea MUCL 33604]
MSARMSILTGFQSHLDRPVSDAEIASQTLHEESLYRFPSFKADDAVTLGLSLRKRFRASRRFGKGKGLVISIQSIAGHTLFACTVGDLGGASGAGDIGLDSWACLEGMISVVKRTGHSSYYVEKSMGDSVKASQPISNIQREFLQGGAFPIWLEVIRVSFPLRPILNWNNGKVAPCCPIAVVACYSGSSVDDHHLVVAGVRDYITKMLRDRPMPPGMHQSTGLPPSAVMPNHEWVMQPAGEELQTPVGPHLEGGL